VESEVQSLPSDRPDALWLAVGFVAGLLVMTFGLVWTLFYGVITPVVPLVLAGVFSIIGRGMQNRRAQHTAEGLLAAAIFGAVSSAIVLIGGM
jgi:hypothetical protein